MTTWIIFTAYFLAVMLFSSSLSNTAVVTISYVFGINAQEWQVQKNKHLKANDTFLIYPKVFYRVNCEAKASGPTLKSNYEYAMSLRLEPTPDMDTVELYNDLHQILLNREFQLIKTYFWCSYWENSVQKQLMVKMKPLVKAETVCGFQTLNTAVIENSPVKFECHSSGGFPKPVHECQLVAQSGATVNINRTKTVFYATPTLSNPYRSEFTFLASSEWNKAKIKCKALQFLQYSGYKESFSEGVSTNISDGITNFTFVQESVKNCVLNYTDMQVLVRCTSGFVYPTTVHRCSQLKTDVELAETTVESIFLQTNNKVTQYAFNNTWKLEGSTINCTLSQNNFYSETFLLNVPKFKNASKACNFKSNSFNINFTCSATYGYPSSSSECFLKDENSTITLQLKNKKNNNNSVLFHYNLRSSRIVRNSVIYCNVKQHDVFQSNFYYRIPEFIKAKSICTFHHYLGNDVVTCKYTAGYPAPDVQCIITNNATTQILNATVERLNIADGDLQQIFKISEKLKQNYHNGSIECTVFQGAVFKEIFIHYITSSVSNVTLTDASGSGDNNVSIKTSLITATLVISLICIVFVLILILTLARVVESVKSHRTLRKYRNREQSSSELDDLLAAAAIPQPELPLPKKLIYTGSSFDVNRLVNDLYHQRGYKAREKSVQDIDQQSLTDRITNSSLCLNGGRNMVSPHRIVTLSYTL